VYPGGKVCSGFDRRAGGTEGVWVGLGGGFGGSCGGWVAEGRGLAAGVLSCKCFFG